MSDPPIISVDKLYLSQRGELSLELVCSAPANPPARLTWSRLEPTTGDWLEISQERRGNTDVWIVNRQVRLYWEILSSSCHYLVQVDSEDGKSVVVINKPMGSHLGHYLCTANNTQGTDARTLHLRGRDIRFLDISEQRILKRLNSKLSENGKLFQFQEILHLHIFLYNSLLTIETMKQQIEKLLKA